MTPIQTDLLHRVEAFLKRTGMPPSTFGRNAARASSFVYRLRDGANITTETIDRVLTYMREYRN